MYIPISVTQRLRLSRQPKKNWIVWEITVMVTVDEIKKMTFTTNRLPDCKVTRVEQNGDLYFVTLEGEELEEFKKQYPNLIDGLINFRFAE
jgi:hypothetical protein